jgi:hypothetical protein
MIWLVAAAATLVGGFASAQNYSNDGYRNDYRQNRITVRCESVGGHRTFCPVGRIERVRVSRQLSQRSCIRGRNWNYDSRGIWVSNGCRANFQVSRGSRNGDRGYGDRTGYGDRNDNGDRYGDNDRYGNNDAYDSNGGYYNDDGYYYNDGNR